MPILFMQAEVNGWVKRAFETSAEEFLALIEEAKGVLKEEKKSREGSGLVCISPQAVNKIVFLGDYGDRGSESVEVYYLLLKLKVSEWKEKEKKIIMLRGNHEGPPDLPVMPHDLPLLFSAKYGAEGKTVYAEIKEFWEYLPYAVLVEGRYLMLHGGLPVNVASIKDIAFAHESHPSSSNFEEILWSDPVEGKGNFYSMRGAGRMFGEDITERVLRAVGVKTLIRSHEPCEGVKVNQGGKVLTLFSRKGSPYFNIQAAYLILDENALKKAKDAEELVRSAARIW